MSLTIVQYNNFSMQHLEACIVDFYFNIKDIEIWYSEKWSVGYEVNIVGSKVCNLWSEV